MGPGGIGKTRLAIEAGREQLGRFKDGIYFVAFASVSVPEHMVYAIGDAVGFSFFGQRPPEAQLFDYLQDKEMLLILDNLEHLLAGVELITSMLEKAPNIKMLVTSRERLNLHAERIFDLRGLSVPEAGDAGALEHDAVKLFVQSATNARFDFALNEISLPTVVRICQLVQGMPLALELAASWLRALTLEDIAAEIEKGMFFLKTSIRDMPARHRSIRAVFDYSWKLLTDEEQAVLRRLSVFRGGFRREAAAEIAGASLPILAALVDKSFLATTLTGRYRRHPLVLQYTKEKLAEHPEEQVLMQERHSLYYLHFAREREKMITTSRGKEALTAIEEELPNIRTVWTRLIENERFDELKTHALVLDRIFRYRIPEGVTFFAQAAAGLDATNPAHHAALGYALALQGFHLLLLGRDDESYACARRALELLQPLGDTQGIMRAQFILGLQLWMSGEASRARALLEESHILSREHPESLHTGIILYFRAIFEWEFRTLPQVRQFFEAAIAEVEALNDPNILAMLKNEYGLYLAWHDFLDEGERLVREGLKPLRETNAPGLEAGILANLALVVYKLGKYDEAEALARDALASAERLYGKQGAVLALIRLSRIALARENYPVAQHYLKEALQTGWALQNLMHGLEILFRLSELDVKQGNAVEAAERLGLVQQQPTFPAFEAFHSHDIKRLLEDLREQLSAEELEEALARGKGMRLQEVVSELLKRL